MTTRLEDALARLEAALAAQRNPVLGGMQAGLPDGEIRQALTGVGLNAPADPISWFGWHNGYVTPAGQSFRGWMAQELQQYPLQVCIERQYPQIVDGIESFREAGILHPNEGTEWFPLGSVRGGVPLVINFGPSGQRGYVSVRNVHAGGFSPDDYQPLTLAEPVEWWAALLKSGIWRYNVVTGLVEVEPDYLSRQPEERRRSGMV